MGDADGPPESSGGRSGNDLPVMPGPEKPLLHIAIEFVESLDNALAEQQMLNVAHGELPADAACIYDVPIESIALPDPSDRYYSSALVKRLEIQTRNQAVCVETDNKGAHDRCHRFSSDDNVGPAPLPQSAGPRGDSEEPRSSEQVLTEN